jgi:hypothetical protein
MRRSGDRAAAAFGLRAPSAWAVLAVSETGAAIPRRRIDMTTGSGFRARQPYYAAEEMDLPQVIQTAEGAFYREVLLRACAAAGLPVTSIRERGVIDRCAAALQIPDEELQARLSAMGKPLGPPWTQDETLSAAAALAISRKPTPVA